MADDFAVQVPSDKCYLSTVRSFCRTLLTALVGDSSTESIDEVVLAVDECCANIIRHRSESLQDGRIRVEVRHMDGLVEFRLRAFCRPDDIACIKPRDLEDVRPGGLGTYIVNSVMDHVAFEDDQDQPGCLALLLTKRFDPTSGSIEPPKTEC